MQLKTVTKKLFNPTLNLVRYRSRSIPALFLDPFGHHKNFWSEIFNAPRPSDVIPPVQRYTGYRVPAPAINFWEQPVSNARDGFRVSLNVNNFAPNEVQVKVIDNTILVEAKHEERAENGERHLSQHFTQQFALSNKFNLNGIVSTLSSDGILTVRVPPKENSPQNIRNINIEQTGSPARHANQN